MEAIEFSASLLKNAFFWIFRSIGGKRFSTALSIIILPVFVIAAIAEQDASPLEVAPWILGTTVLFVAAIYAIRKTRFYEVPLSACDTTTVTAAWISMIGGYIVMLFVFAVFVFTVAILTAAVGAVGSSVGRR